MWSRSATQFHSSDPLNSSSISLARDLRQQRGLVIGQLGQQFLDLDNG
jgi:hypothetical protein